MKKVFLVTSLFSLLGNIAFSQDSDVTPKTRLGMKINPGFAWIQTNESTMEQSASSFAFGYGLTADFRIAENYFITSGIEVVGMGSIVKFGKPTYFFNEVTNKNSDLLLTERKLKYQFVEIPLILKMRTREIGYLRYFGLFGFNTGIKLKAQAEDEYSNTSLNVIQSEKVNISSETALFRSSMNVGGGIEKYLSGTTSLTVSLIWNNGLNNLFRKSSNQLSSTNNAFNGIKQNGNIDYLSLNIGILF